MLARFFSDSPDSSLPGGTWRLPCPGTQRRDTLFDQAKRHFLATVRLCRHRLAGLGGLLRLAGSGT